MGKLRLLEKIYFGKEHLYLIFEKENVQFEAGHALGIVREGIKRYYSVASAPSDEVVTFVVHLVPGGKMSSIFERSKPGDLWEVEDVIGKLSLEPFEKRHKVAVLSAGTGVAPFRSIYREALARGIDTDVIHVHSARYFHEIPFSGEWERYGVTFIPTITRDPHYEGEKGRIDREKIERLIPDYRERFFMVCGPAAFVSSMVKTLLSMGVKRFLVEGW